MCAQGSDGGTGNCNGSGMPGCTNSSCKGKCTYTGRNPAVAEGSLLAIPAAMAAHVNVTTVPGAKIKQALVDYGGYLVDGTGDNSTASPGHPAGAMEAAICMDAVVNSELRGLLGYAPTYNSQEVSWHGPGKQLYDDLTAIFQALHAVVNNGPSSIGGGGIPRVPLKPPLCE